MANPALYEEWISSVHRLKIAQRAAGIDEPLKDLSGRNAYAYSRKANNFTADYRKAVFAIPHGPLRLRVIREDRENYRIYKAYRESELGGLHHRVRTDGDHIRRRHLWGAVGFGACIVWLGSEFWGSAGALLGAVIAILMAADRIRRADRLAAADAEAARQAIPEEEARLERLCGDDGTFSESEAQTGLPDAPGQDSSAPLELQQR